LRTTDTFAFAAFLFSFINEIFLFSVGFYFYLVAYSATVNAVKIRLYSVIAAVDNGIT
jgi:hypothetical protein